MPQDDGTLARRLGLLVHPGLLIIDEIGYLPLSEGGGRLFFQLVSARHERASTILTTNKGFEEWGSVLGDDVMAAAMLDRILYRCHVVNIRGGSYRMRQYRAMHGLPDAEKSGVAGESSSAMLQSPPPPVSEVDRSGTF